MLKILPVCAAFALFFLSDWNDWRGGTAPLRWCFPAGGAVLAADTVYLCLTGRAASGGAGRLLAFAGAALFAWLLIYSLFFALPAAASYTEPGQKRPACTAGVYALCRHPGVLWLTGLLACLHPAAGYPLWAVILATVLNTALVTFEDCAVFPAVLAGYCDYRRVTPFLIPSGKSVRACFRGEK
jgi:protein-S-isoprenylcysteine O-methyltransferase Ste14